MITIVDVAKKANISITTVSRVLNESTHKVNKITRDKVLEAVKELDYRPNALAQSLSRKRSMTIGVVIPDISNPYYAEIVRGIQDKADEAGYSVLIQNTDRKIEQITRSIYVFREKHTDGVIFAGGTVLSKNLIPALKNLASRSVAIGRFEIDIPSIRIDNPDAVYKAVSHLIELGHREIAYINGPVESSSTMMDRLQGFRQALKHFKCPLRPGFISTGTLTIEGGYNQLRKLISKKPHPEAVILANDQMAFGAAKAIREAKLRIPEDIALIGFDNIPLCSYFDPPITSIEIPRYELGHAAMETLLNLITGKEIEKTRWCNVKLVKRQSTVL